MGLESMAARNNLLLLVTLVTLAACDWFDVGPRKLDSGLDQADGGGDRSDEDAGWQTGTGGTDGRGPERSPDSGMDGGDAEIDAPVEAGADAPSGPGGDDPDPLAADLTWQLEARRFAVVDDSPLPYEQTRLWLLVHGGQTRHRLVSFRADAPADPWLDTTITDITSNPEATTAYDYGTYYQRVFFTRAGKLDMYRYDQGDIVQEDDDGGTDDQPETFEPESGYTLPGGNLAAIPVNFGGTESFMFVLAPAEKDGVPGHYCLLELNLRTQAHVFRCSSAPVLSEDTEIVAAISNRYIYFIARAADGRIIVIAYDGSSIVHASFDTPYERPIGASLSIFDGDDDTAYYNLHVMVVSDDGRAYHGIIAKDLAGDASWVGLPALPLGVHLRMTGAAISSIDDIQIEGGGAVYRSTTVYGLGEDGVAYHVETEDSAGIDRWKTQWAPVARLDHDEDVLALGGISRTTRDSVSLLHTLVQSWHVVGGARGRVLQEARETASGASSEDHMRPGAQAPVPLALASGAEISVASGADLGIAATAQRSSEAPHIVLAGSVDNGSSWHSFPLVALPVEDEDERPAATLDPVVGYDRGRVHLIDREVPDYGMCASLRGLTPQRIVYRRGHDARSLATLGADHPDVKIVASGGSYGAPSMVVTWSEGGSVVHAVFNDLASSARYWRLRPGSSTREPIERTFGPELSMSTLQLASGVDSSVYVAGLRDQVLRICDVSDDELPETLFCADADLDAQVLHRAVPFGLPEAQAQGACPMVEGQHYKCFQDGKPYSLAVSLREPNKIYVAYAGEDQGASSIYLSVSSGGADYGAWTTTRVHPRSGSDKKDYFDAEVTVDAQGTTTVTYSALEPKSANTSAQVFSAHRTGDQAAFHIAPLGEWDASGLQYDCVTERWALGDYRDPDTLGGRSLHALRSNDAAPSSHAARWLNANVLP
jgi:hypothetical protein